MDRKEFLRGIGAGVAFGFLAEYLESCSKAKQNDSNVDITIDLTASSSTDLNQVGGSMYVDNGNIIVVNLGNGNYDALSSICTHQGCLVAFDSTSGEFLCPCHGSVFNTNGNVLAGPAPSPLKKYTVTLSGTMLQITG